MNALIPPHGEPALFLQKRILFVSKRAQGHMMNGGLEGSCGDPGEERSFKGIQSEGGGGLRLFYMMMPFLT
ncbi:MAG TPA: hypothetical protein DEF35_16440 [Paenibacillus sp.]|nr:hypothetical protein P363_0123425 [Paenibacillus sp. MAEPY1]KGP84728.1 hypothetical protein P364_0103430 [Paenibacillus sp. MAEPY2]OZQ61115.1 hypothetical protein CA599_28910 [Paenibacillus taichungensis]HBU83214.1 hypothetical protein [Paenibacillus sp.]